MQDRLVGFTLNRKYRLRKFLAEELLGRVYLADNIDTGEMLNVKVLHEHLADNLEAFGRFGREMMATATIRHPNVVRLIDFGEHHNFHFLVFEQIVATPLHQVLADERRLLPFRTAHIAHQLAEALEAAHSEDIIHRNLSSTNVLLLHNAYGDYVKIRDFALARIHDQDGNPEDGGLTNAGVRVGDIRYMAPEYVTGGVLDARSDAYALGVLMFEMLVGDLPFSSDALWDVEGRATPPAPSSRVQNIPPWLDTLVVSLMAPIPHHRPPRCMAVVEALERGTGQKLDRPGLIPLEDPDAVAEELARRRAKREQSSATPSVFARLRGLVSRR
ncbi:MAG: serine/threonine protein kinase [Proteobacteria bacterium]|jgi:eukaryotic-like serine/threonine-protein kinase|nr:serine/threonine protein kinase [Pseudomonadota bacterium]